MIQAENGGLFFENGFMPFNLETCYLGANVPEQKKFDISLVHMRYNKTAVDQLMHPNHKKITILREPTTYFISSWRYYSNFYPKLRKNLPLYENKVFDADSSDADFLGEMEDFLKKPLEYLGNVPFSHGSHFFLYNPQMVFFGYPSYLLKTTRKVDNINITLDFG